jgi:quinoprotein glucose dehydrogenase
MDIPCAPILVDVTMNGRTIKALAQPTKQAFLYVFNRETGEPIWPIEERPVEKGDVPGEWYSPTQPFPTKPPAYDRQSTSIDSLIDFTPELRAQATELVKKYKMGPMFTPNVVSKREGPLGTLQSGTGGTGGGTNWPGGSYDPETHIVYVSSQSAISSVGLVPPPPGYSDIAYISGNAISGPRLEPASSGPGGSRMAPAAGRGAPPPPAAAEGGGGGGLNVQGLPLVKPPYGRISAIDMNKGDIILQIPHGETPDNIKNNPALKGLNIPRTGQPGTVGTLVTKTLVIAGESRFTITATGQRGAMLRAYNKATGKEEGAVYMPASQSGSPMTYMSNGKQYIVLAVGGGAYPGELLAFRLPG